jgi:hypothetical protein
MSVKGDLTVGEVVKLTQHPVPNFLAWKKSFMDVMRVEHPLWIPLLEKKEFTDIVLPEEPSAAEAKNTVLFAIWLEDFKAARKKKETFQDSRLVVVGKMVRSFHNTTIMRLKAINKDGYEDYVKDGKVIEMWKMIEEAHIGGAAPKTIRALIAEAQLTLQQAGNQSLEAYMTETMEKVEELSLLGVDVTGREQYFVVKFLLGLESPAMKQQFTTWTAEDKLPKTFSDARTKVMSWQDAQAATSGMKGKSGTQGYQQETFNTTHSENKEKTNERNIKPRCCWVCGKFGHKAQNCKLRKEPMENIMVTIDHDIDDEDNHCF